MKVKLRSVAHSLLRPLVTIVSHLQFQTKLSRTENVVEKVKRFAMEDSANFITSNIEFALLFDSKKSLWDHALLNTDISGLHLEFGVWKGNSLNYFAKSRPSSHFHGFDSFVGLQENWEGTNLSKGAFDLAGKLPKMRNNVSLHKGWFEDTLPTFLKRNSQEVAFVHLDADTYISTKYVLKALENQIVAGTVLIFDEFIGFPNWRNGEFKAWQEFSERKNLRFKYLGFSDQSVSIKVN